MKIKKEGGYAPTTCYLLYDGKVKVGELQYKIYGPWILLIFIGIYEEYRHKGYATMAIKELLETHPTKSLVGESLEGSKNFWKKRSKEFNGKMYKTAYSYNCNGSFVIPKCEISNEKLLNLLKLCAY